MRRAVPGLASAVPIGQRLPGVFQEDDLMMRFVQAFDDGVAPVLATLDGLEAYVDPRLAPEDFLEWLAGWVGVEVDGTWSAERLRAIVAQAAEIHRRRGTVAGVVEAVRLVVDADVEVEETGGVQWSASPGPALPGEAEPRLVVRVRCDRPDDVDSRRLDAVVASVKPAHVPHHVEVLGRDAAESAPSGDGQGPEGVPATPAEVLG
jgi:phage tail-like protein